MTADDADGLTAEYQAQHELVLEKRDRFIAGRVNETLKVGEVGLIFLGLLHTLERFSAVGHRDGPRGLAGGAGRVRES